MNPSALELRDIHLPEPIAWWPLAPGWWFLVALVAASCVLSAAYIWYRRGAFRRALQRELAAIAAQHARAGDDAVAARALSVLARRAALANAPRSTVAGLHSAAWIAYLKKAWPPNDPQATALEHLLRAPYQAHPELDLDTLLPWFRGFIRSLPYSAVEDN